MTDEEYDELFLTQKTKQSEQTDIYDELFNPKPVKQPQQNDISETRLSQIRNLEVIKTNSSTL